MYSFAGIFFGTLAFLSLLLTIWQWAVARRYPLHQRTQNKSFVPAVTFLKPLKGCDANTAKCLSSWLTQQYSAPVQILFGVSSPEDPVCDLVRQLMREHPPADAELVICNQKLGPNGKVSTLAQLEPHIKYDVLVISDADVRVPNHFVADVVAPLQQPAVGLVHCFYQLANPSTHALRWEEVAVNADFWTQVLQAQSLGPIDFALGAVMCMPRARLDRIGGFRSLLEYLADDYQLGRQIARGGGELVLSPTVVECWSSPMNCKEVWSHQLRWARTIRVCRPISYFFSILANATLWPLVWWLHQPALVSSATLCGCLLFRVFTARDNQARLTRKQVGLGDFWIVWLKDLLNVAIWALAFLGSHIQWRGEQFRIARGGKLVKVVLSRRKRGIH